MARAIYLIETEREEQVNASEALNTIWFGDTSGAYIYDDVADMTFHESARHTVELSWNGIGFSLGFESQSEMYCYEGNHYPGEIRTHRAVAYNFGKDVITCSLIRRVFESFEVERRRFRSQKTWADPSTDEFVGECSYRLVSVNDIPVDGPSYKDTYHEQFWEGLSEEYTQRWKSNSGEKYDPATSMLCWLHYISIEHAQQLGIAANGDKAVGHGADYPPWVSKLMAAQSDVCWIHSDQIQASYAEASPEVEPITNICVYVGSGSEWDPKDTVFQLNHEERFECGEYPDSDGPLLEIEISRDPEHFPAELNALLPYWRQLFRLRSK